MNRDVLIRESLYYFDRYRNERIDHPHEVLYNMARIYAHLNMTGRAVEIFEEVLAAAPSPKLVFKAAFNLV